MTFWGYKRAGRGHDFPRRSLHLRIALGKLLERSRQNTDDMEVQSEPKITLKNDPKTDPRRGIPSAWGRPRRGTPSARGRLEGLLGALGRLLSMEL